MTKPTEQDEDKMKRIVKGIKRLHVDDQLDVLHALVSNRPHLVFTKAVIKWAHKNASYIVRAKMTQHKSQ